MRRDELVEHLRPHLVGLHWRTPSATRRAEESVALAQVASGVLLRGPGHQLELILTTPEWRGFVRAIKAGEFDDTL